MRSSGDIYDAVVVGGGFYGVTIAVHLRRERGLNRVLIIERESAILSRASRRNQARVHNGYHYPRSLTTAFRSRVNLPRFVHDWPDSIYSEFDKVYAIARHHSKVTARQFERFCREIGATIQPAPASLSRLFDPRLIEATYLVQEYAFDVNRLHAWAIQQLHELDIELMTNAQAQKIFRDADDRLTIALDRAERGNCEVSAKLVFNCTYSGLNQLGGDFPALKLPLKQEITEMALMQMPPELAQIGVTVMDGPFFSTMPYPSRGLHTLSHVRFTPHLHWIDTAEMNPYARLDAYEGQTRVDRMVRDVARYMPSIRGAQYMESIFEIKTVLAKSEGDDGRPIVFERHSSLPGCYSVLGGKLDNIYDILEKIDGELSTYNAL
jgi:glycine/D-amino acid oxidase-like deaminating enzyme